MNEHPVPVSLWQPQQSGTSGSDADLPTCKPIYPWPKDTLPKSTRKGLTEPPKRVGPTTPPPPRPVDIALAPLQLFLPGQHLLPSPPSSSWSQAPASPEPWPRGRACGGPYFPGVVPFHSVPEKSLACKDAPFLPPSVSLLHPSSAFCL